MSCNVCGNLKPVAPRAASATSSTSACQTNAGFQRLPSSVRCWLEPARDRPNILTIAEHTVSLRCLEMPANSCNEETPTHLLANLPNYLDYSSSSNLKARACSTRGCAANEAGLGHSRTLTSSATKKPPVFARGGRHLTPWFQPTKHAGTKPLTV